MANSKRYRFSGGNGISIVFDSKGYIVEAKGFGLIIWSTTNIDKELIGKHIDELAEMLKKNGTSKEAYLNFEAKVHVWLLKKMLKDAQNAQKENL